MEQVGRPAKPRSPKVVPNCIYVGDAFQYHDPVQSLWLTMVKLVFADGPDINLNRLSREACNLYLLDLYDREVRNGGFDQFIYNSSGSCFEETKAALVNLGATTMLVLLEQAASLFPHGVVPKDPSLRRQALFTIPANCLAKLDDEFNQSVGCRVEPSNRQCEDPRQIAIAYMKAHAECLVAQPH